MRWRTTGEHRLPWLEQLILDMLQKDPRLRPGAAEVLCRLSLAPDSTIAVASSVTNRGVRSSRSVVGRDYEIDALIDDFERAQRGKGRVVVDSAEAGLGKTTPLDAFLRLLEERGDAVRVGRGRCSRRLSGSEAYLPVLEVLESFREHAAGGRNIP